MLRSDGRRHLGSALVTESLVERQALQQTTVRGEFPILPDVHLIKIGGRSIFDRGAAAILPLVEVLVEARKKHSFILSLGGGIRERHVYRVALDLGLPVGGLATLSGPMAEQNAFMLHILLAKHGGLRVSKDGFEKLPLYLSTGMTPIIVANPPYRFFEYPHHSIRTPMHGSDVGALLLADTLSAKSMIFIKDVDGLFTADPNREPSAKHIAKITARELEEAQMKTFPVHPTCVRLVKRLRNLSGFRIVNGLKPDTLVRALEGEDVGTLIARQP